MMREDNYKGNLFDSIGKLKKLLKEAGIAIYNFDKDSFWFVNQKFLEMFEYQNDEVLTKGILSLVSDDDKKKLKDKLSFQIDNSIESMDYLFQGVTKSGELKYIHLYCLTLKSRKDRLLVAIFIDKNRIIKINREFEKLANYDNLTKIFNKRVFEEELDRILELARRKRTKVALLLFDIDNFKRINDSFGHNGGDIALSELTKRITKILRKSELFARIGGDEFALIVENFRDTDEIVALIKRLQESLKGKIVIDNIPIRITLSIGVSIFPDHSQDKFSMIQSADIALYEAKKAGKNCYIFYEKSAKELLENIELSKSLESALEKNQMQIVLQPQLSLKERNIYSAEALLRWNHPTKGLLKPKDFLAQASKAGVLYRLDLFVFESVLKFLKEIQKKSSIKIAINISNALFHHQKFSDSIRELQKEYGEFFSKVELELDEKLLQNRDKYTKKIIKDLTEYGFLISIDDFGLGLTSFKALQDFNINRLNINISFIKELKEKDNIKSIVKAIIDMAHALNLKVLAEGVEDRETFEILKELNCDEAQGYYFCHPLTLEEFKRRWITTSQS